MKRFLVKYRSLERDLKGNDDVLKEVVIEAYSGMTAVGKVRSSHSDVHYVVSVSEM